MSPYEEVCEKLAKTENWHYHLTNPETGTLPTIQSLALQAQCFLDDCLLLQQSSARRIDVLLKHFDECSAPVANETLQREKKSIEYRLKDLEIITNLLKGIQNA